MFRGSSTQSQRKEQVEYWAVLHLKVFSHVSHGCSLFSGKNQRVQWGKTASSLLYKQGNVTHMIVYLDSTSLQTDEGYRTRGLTAGFQNQIRMTLKLCLHSKYHPASPLFPHTSISFYPPLTSTWLKAQDQLLVLMYIAKQQTLISTK